MTTGLPPSERVRILKQEFAALDINQDMQLSRDELFRALDDMVKNKLQRSRPSLSPLIKYHSAQLLTFPLLE